MKKNWPWIVTGVVVVAFITALAFLFRRRTYTIQEGELTGEQAIGGTELMTTWDKKSNEVIEKLHPKVRKQYSDFVNDLEKQGIKYRLYSGLRTFQEQEILYGKGRTTQEMIVAGLNPAHAKPQEKKVTNAKPGSSYHNYGLATDGVEIVNGQAIWTNPKQNIITETAKKYGLYWGGNFTSFKDTPHFEYQGFGNVSTLLTMYNGGKIDSNGYLIV